MRSGLLILVLASVSVANAEAQVVRDPGADYQLATRKLAC